MSDAALNITVYGAGAWGTALAIAYAQHHHVTLWGRDTAALDECARTRTNQALGRFTNDLISTLNPFQSPLTAPQPSATFAASDRIAAPSARA